MVVFWIVAALLSAAAASVILSAAARGARGSGPVEAPSLALHRRELAEVDALAERGLIADAERESLRAEAARRLLAAAGDAPLATGPASRSDRILVLVIAAAAPMLALALYLVVGAPGYPDQPFLKRVAAWRSADPRSLTAAEMAGALEAVVKERPKDPGALRALGIAQMASGQYTASQASLRKAIELAPDRADLWASLGEAFAGGAQGVVDDDAQSAFNEALKRDPQNLAARYFLGRAAFAAGDKAGALKLWHAVLDGLSPTDSRRASLQAEITAAETGALAPGTGGPSADQVAAAAGSVGAPQIRAMVDRLAQQVAAMPNDADGWVRLVRAYGVLGDAAKRDAALKTARAQFAARPDVLKALDEAAAAKSAGIAP